MKPDISEFSYAFALTRELLQLPVFYQTGAPEFLSQVAEGKTGGGWDVKLPAVPVFLQFKLSDCLTTRAALDHSTFGLPYYRFNLRAQKHSEQHRLLVDLEANGNIVWYAAPRFHKPEELNLAFVHDEVAKRSAFVKPSAIGNLPDENAHSVSFGSTGHRGMLRSDPRAVELTIPSDAFGRTLQAQLLDARVWRSRDAFYRAIGDELIDLFQSRATREASHVASQLQTRATNISAIDYARRVAIALFGCELLVAAGPKGV